MTIWIEEQVSTNLSLSVFCKVGTKLFTINKTFFFPKNTLRFQLFNRDFKQLQRGRRRERHMIRENPKCPLRMTGGKHVDVRRSGPTWVELISRCLKTRVFAFVSSALLKLNNPWYQFRRTVMLDFSCCVRYFILKKDRESWSELKPVGEHVSTMKYLFWKLM